MSKEASPAVSDPSTIYISDFRRHLAQVRAHLVGNNERPLHPSYIQPTGYWKTSEKDIFFHALSVHSRFRPDLIAASIGTKSTIDVCTYIDALEKGLSRHKSVLMGRADLEAAMEVSDSWVRWEEGWAGRLMAFEDEQDEENLANEGVDEDGDNQKTLCRAQERILNCLDLHHLRVMESILRLGESEIGTESGDHSGISGRVPISDELIDPALLKISQHPESYTISNPTTPPPDTSHLKTSISTSPHVLHPGSSLDPSTQIPQSDIPDTPYEAATDPSDLSPASRRRYQKRLYMRKKRAEKTGSTVIAGVTKLRPGRKVRGELPRLEQEASENAGVCVNEDHLTIPIETQGVGDDNNGDDIQEVPDLPDKAHRKNKSGLTKPYKLKRKFEAHGIDANFLTKGDLGLFHLSTLSRLMRLYKSGYDKENTSTASSISADAIRLMTAVIVEFASEVVHRTIISREQEKAMKGNIKIYGRMHHDITPENINHVLEMMGMKGVTKIKYFADLLGEDLPAPEHEPGDESNLPTDESIPDMNNTSMDSDDQEGFDESPLFGQTASFPALLPLHRELHPPLIYLPRSLLEDPSMTPTSLIPMDIDEQELSEQLQEEQELDATDKYLAHRYETELWKRYVGEK